MIEQTLEAGRKYRGTFWLNEFGEIHVRPEQKGTKPGNMRLVAENECFSLYQSKQQWKLTVKFNKTDFTLHNATQRLLFIVSQIKQYTKKWKEKTMRFHSKLYVGEDTIYLFPCLAYHGDMYNEDDGHTYGEATIFWGFLSFNFQIYIIWNADNYKR